MVTAPMAVFSFIEEYDLSGKIVVPFCAHGTGGLAASVRDITAAEVLEPIGVSSSYFMIALDNPLKM